MVGPKGKQKPKGSTKSIAAKDPQAELEIEIHHYEYNPEKGIAHYDEDNEILMGWYWHVIDKKTKEALTSPIGPFQTFDEARDDALTEYGYPE